MGKISPISSKYIVHATINITGIVDKPDVIGAIFGQTEGLLGADLELRELQRSGRIGRIEVNVETKAGKTAGTIIIPSSLDKAETAIVGAALEVIQRIGPCTAKIRVENIEDVRISKRKFVTDRAKELLKNLMDTSMPDSQELADEVAYSVRVMEITEYGRERLPAGPGIEDSDEIIIVEGRADVINLLKHGFKNAIAVGGTGMPESIPEICKQKTVTVLVDGDRGGDLIIKELLEIADIDFVTKAPDGKEIEELTKKEIHKTVRSRISAEQAKMEFATATEENKKPNRFQKPQRQPRQQPQARQPRQNGRNDRNPREQKPRQPKVVPVSDEDKAKLSGILEDLIGTRGACVLDNSLNMLGKIPISELASTIKSMEGIHAVVFDGAVEKDIVIAAEKAQIKYVVGMENKAKSNSVRIMTAKDF